MSRQVLGVWEWNIHYKTQTLIAKSSEFFPVDIKSKYNTETNILNYEKPLGLVLFFFSNSCMFLNGQKTSEVYMIISDYFKFNELNFWQTNIKY